MLKFEVFGPVAHYTPCCAALRSDYRHRGGRLPDPAIIAAEIVKDLEAALAEFTAVAASLKRLSADAGQRGTFAGE